jgi:hypothetical protein
MTLLWWRRPDITVHPAGYRTWEVRAISRRGKDWLHVELGNGAAVILDHHAALEICFKAIRDGLIVCSDPADTRKEGN